ncbi:MAG: hypothetical protein Q4C70_01800 [Planctomycetia bacterium]|nr:hypothetical protein [Planctomycetia bacterium]
MEPLNDNSLKLFDERSYSSETLKAECPNLYRYASRNGATFVEYVYLRDICPNRTVLLAIFGASAVGSGYFLQNWLVGNGETWRATLDLVGLAISCVCLLFIMPFWVRWFLFYDSKLPIRTVRIEKNTLYITETGNCETIENFDRLKLRKRLFPCDDALFQLPIRKKCVLINVRYGRWIAIGISKETFTALEEYEKLRVT